jgi:hypothetical protein
MIGKLQIIFDVDAVTLHLRVARKRLILLEQLGGIAARAIVDAIAGILATRIATRRALLLPATAATAAGLTIIDQVLVVLCLETNPAVLQQIWMQMPPAPPPTIGNARPPRSPDDSDCMTKDAGYSPFSTSCDENASPCAVQ